jgi:hypothetical protein
MSSLSVVRISDTYSSSTYNPITVNAYSQNKLSDSYKELVGYIMVSSSINSLRDSYRSLYGLGIYVYNYISIRESFYYINPYYIQQLMYTKKLLSDLMFYYSAFLIASEKKEKDKNEKGKDIKGGNYK